MGYNDNTTDFFIDAVLTDHGRQLPGAFRRVGLVDVGNDGRVCVMRGGSPGARWFELSMAQLRPRLVGTGKVTNEEIDRMLALFADPEIGRAHV